MLVVPDVPTTVVGIVGTSGVVSLLTSTVLSAPSPPRSIGATEWTWPSPLLTTLGAATPTAGALSLGPMSSEPSGGVFGDKMPVDLCTSIALTSIMVTASASLPSGKGSSKLPLPSTVSAAGIAAVVVPGTADPLFAVLKGRPGSLIPSFHGLPIPDRKTPTLPPTVHTAVATEVSGAH